ncbi:MAG: ATP-dependent DNA helicase UvrD2 [Actinomycetota bacterium]
MLPPLPAELTPADLAGPDALGRSLLIGPDAEVPAPWDGADEVAVDAGAEPGVVERLHRAWRERRRLVIRWSGPLPDPDPVTTDAFHRLGPDHELGGERLHFAVTANAVDARDHQVAFEPLQLAMAAGASTAQSSGETAPSTEAPSADVRLTDGSRHLVDGGPLDLDLPAVVGSLVPRVHLIGGSLRPLRVRGAPNADLAPDQLTAVAHRTGAARILAPAGSGKTRVLTERSRHLVADCGVAARSVCMVAFNRRAKDEMRDRLTDVAALDIRTLNSLALALATGSGPFRAGGEPDRRLATIDEPEARRLLDRILPGRRRKRLTDPLEPWIDALSACRLGLRDPEEIERSYGGDVADFPQILERYRAELARRNALDFDEQILRAIDRLLTDPAARRTARSVAPLLLVDEFQDLTPAHLLLLRILAGPAGEIFAVGDDDQTIYGYAGASPDWLIEFERFFPGAADHHLTVNYRCPDGVVAAAVNLLSHNRRRVTKTIDAGPGAEPDGLIVLGGEPQQGLVDHVGRLVGDGAEPTDIAVLARVNASLLPAAVHLAEAGVPVVRPWGLGPEILDRSGVGAALAWLRLTTGPAKGFASDDIRLALRRPPRSLHPRVADWACEQRSLSDLAALAGRLNTERESETVGAFADDIARLRDAAADGATTEELLTTVYDEIGLLGAASQLDTSQRSARRAAHGDELAAVRAIAGLHPEPATFDSWLRSHLAAIPAYDPNEPRRAVTLATIHTTKGLEWPHVIVHDVRGDLHPHQLATDTEEERRIFHVAVTRGRRSVAIAPSGPPSPFVEELARLRPTDEPWPTEPIVSAGAGGTGNGSGRSTRAGKGGPAERAEPGTPREAALRDVLASWRRERSKADGVPAYVVFDNKTLDAIARVEPASLGDLGAISGIGPAKLERYGADVLGLVASFDED